MNSFCIFLAAFCFTFAVNVAATDTWLPWTVCSKTCGGGKQTVSKMCGRFLCYKLEASCNTFGCNEPLMEAQWTQCSKSCNTGVRYALDNEGDTLQTIACNVQPCTPVVSQCSANVVFLVDKTGTVGIKNWAVSKQFVVDVIRGLNGNTKIGAISYSTDAEVAVALGGSQDVASIESAVFDMKYDGSAATTLFGMKKMRNAFEGVSGKSVAVMISDGPTVSGGNGDPEAIAEASAAKSAGVKIIGIAVGSTNEELSAMVSDSTTDLLGVDSYRDLNTLTEDVIAKICA